MQRKLGVLAGALALAASVLPADGARAVSVTARDVARDVGIYAVELSWSASTPDVNRDGWRDLLIVPHSDGPARLYRNDRGRFTRIASTAFPKKDRHDCAWADVNVDGRPDAYCTNGADSGTSAAPNELWIQGADGNFVDRAAAWGVTDATGRGRVTTFVNANSDTLPDLYVGNYYPRADGLPTTNRLFINVGGRSFRSAAEYGLDHNLGALSIQVVDYDKDGRQDLLVAGTKIVKLFRNVGGARFEDVSKKVGIAFGALSARLDDVDRDGYRDLILVRPTSLLVKYGGPGGVLTARHRTRSLSGGSRLATADANGDGYLDLYVVQSDTNPDLLLLGPDLASSPIPQATSGGGQAVTAFDHDRNGLADFVVLNGGAGRGPVQLIAHFPA